MTNLETLFEERLAQFVETSPENRAADLGVMRIYEAPLLGIASVADPLWLELQKPEVVGPHHQLPEQWLAGAKSVISFFLPYSEAVREANRTEDEPAQEWLVARYEGEILNNAARRFLVDAIAQAGGQAISPCLDQRFAVTNLRANWSERHAAFIAGLGTFSLNRSLITRRGTAGRLGSVVTDLELHPTARSYQANDEYCLYCGACIDRCPAAAITMAGKEHAPCKVFVNQVKERHAPRYGCGKCQTAVPCEAAVP